MENIEQILKELYELDPQLKANEPALRQIISEVIKNKPATKIDPVFLGSLKLELGRRANMKMQKTNWLEYFKNFNLVYPVGAFAVLLIILLSFRSGQQNPITQKKYGDDTTTSDQYAVLPIEQQSEKAKNVLAFASKEDFIKYLENSQGTGFAYGRGGANLDMAATAPATESFSSNAQSKAAVTNPAPTGPDRFSSTNVQVGGIDEPDIVKTDGNSLFISLESPYYYYGSPMPTEKPLMEPGVSSDSMRIAPPYNPPPQESQILKAFPASELKKIGSIDKQGNLLLTDNTLVVFTYEGIYGYDVKIPENPKRLWHLKYENNTQLNTARLKDGKIYFVTQNYINYQDPCPIRPFSLEGKMLEITCPSIYHPIAPISDSVTYSAFSINPKNGEVQNKVSFLGSYSSTVYMSEENLYISYTVQPDTLALMVDFLNHHGKGILPDSILNKIKQLQTYDISNSSKLNEMSQILEKYYQGLSPDDRLTKENELSNKMNDYVKTNQRKLVSTGIAKIKLSNMALENTGQIPGTLLNQFSLDEYQGNLRVASTIGQNGFWWGWGFNANNIESINEVYILNSNLDVLGTVTDLGKSERIYSARFIQDKAYLVTFRQIDPFYVLDLKDPKNPKMSGELKIPGFSSYLHPLEPNLILGIGQENGQVKLSLFDVSDPQNPKETDKYLLKEYWSEAQNNHRAFLQDSKYGIFFLPAGQNGYIFSYKEKKLSLTKAISSLSAKRAVFISDMLYVISDDTVTVLNENTWEKIKESDLR